MQSIECPRATPHANHRDASRRSPATKSKTRTRATARVTRARRSLCPPRASTAPPTHVHAAPAHMDCVHHLRSIAHALTPPALRSPHALNPKRCSPFPASVGYAVRPSTRQRARRDRLDAHLAPPPPHRPHVLRMCRGALRPATPPYRPTGTESLYTGARTSRSTAPNPLERHEHAAEPRRSTHKPSPCMHVCVYRSAPLPLLSKPC
jgi:hypothetical protein